METRDDFFETIMDVIKCEIEITETYQGKIFALVEDEECFSICSVPVPNKDLDDDEMIFKLLETQGLITQFMQKIRMDGKKPIAFAHTEFFHSEIMSKVVIFRVLVDDDGKNTVIGNERYMIKNVEMFVDENGNMKKTKPKLVEVED